MSTPFTMEMVDIEKHIEYSLTVGLRACFELDELYKYNDDDLISEIMITADYPDLDSTNKKPHVIVTGISYDVADTSLNKNKFRDIIDNGQHVATEYLNLISFSANILCFTRNSGTAKDLTNRCFNYILFGKSEIFNDLFYMDINRMNKAPVSMPSDNPENIFFCSINISGSLNWVGIKNYNLNLIRSIKQTIIARNN